MVHETPALYERIVKPYIDSFSASRTQWRVITISHPLIANKRHRRVDDILSGKSEQNKVLFSCPEFLILPDMKWDLVTVSTLYLVAIAHNHARVDYNAKPIKIRSMRDLRRVDIPWLKKIRREATRIVQEKWGLCAGGIRCYIHYQPSYCEYRGSFRRITREKLKNGIQTTFTCTL